MKNYIQSFANKLRRFRVPLVNNQQNVQIRLARFSKEYGKDFAYDIHPNCEMYGFLKTHPAIKDAELDYYASGESMLLTFKEILSGLNYKANDINRFLDFACGYGRFSRFLVSVLDPKKITVSDIDKGAVDFCKKNFGVNG